MPHTRLSNVPDLERSAVLLQRHVVFAGQNDAARSGQPISCAGVRGHVRARVEELRAHVRYCAQAPVDKFALGSGDVIKRRGEKKERKKPSMLPNPCFFFYRRDYATFKQFPQFEGLIFHSQSRLITYLLNMLFYRNDLRSAYRRGQAHSLCTTANDFIIL